MVAFIVVLVVQLFVWLFLWSILPRFYTVSDAFVGCIGCHRHCFSCGFSLPSIRDVRKADPMSTVAYCGLRLASAPGSVPIELLRSPPMLPRGQLNRRGVYFRDERKEKKSERSWKDSNMVLWWWEKEFSVIFIFVVGY